MNPKENVSPVINVTPLIDVLLVLLIIFMVISPIRPYRFKALVPQKSDDERSIVPNPLTLVVTVEKDLQVRLNQLTDMGSVSDLSKLNAKLADTFQQRKEAHTFRTELADRADVSMDQRVQKTVIIKAARSISYGDVAKVIDGIKGAGAQPIGLQIDDLAQ